MRDGGIFGTAGGFASTPGFALSFTLGSALSLERNSVPGFMGPAR
jgi:hypothetical protein